MAYIAQADLVPRRMTNQELVELTDDAGSGEVDTAVVTAVLDEASGVVDSYCGGRYKLPLVASEQVKSLTADIAVQLLFLRRRRVPEEVQKARDQAMSFLRDVSNGKASLDQAAAKQVTGLSVQKKDHTVAENQDVFDNEKLKKF